MREIFVDTNIFLRFLVRDNEKQYRAARTLFLKIKQGKISGFTSLLVVAEIVWVLDSFYHFSREKIITALQSLLEFPNLEVEQAPIIREALRFFGKRGNDFLDCYNYAKAIQRGTTRIASFDADWDRFKGVERINLKM